MNMVDHTSNSIPAIEPAYIARRRLAVAGHFVRTQRVGGAEQMLYNLLAGFAAHAIDTELLCGSRSNLSDAFLSSLGDECCVRVLECGGAGVRFVAEQRACLEPGLSADAILFPNYYVPPLVPRRLGRVSVVIHDFQYRHFPEYFSRRKYAWLRLSQAASIRLADQIIVISDFVKRDAIRLFGDRYADKIAVVPNALPWDRFAVGRRRTRPMAEPYILSVAAQYPHKNLETLIRAFAVVAGQVPDVQLVLCGQKYDGLSGVMGRASGISTLIRELELTQRIHLTGFVDDAALGQWYSHAEMFAFPSIFEGFGMPPVEALSFGLPTLTTSTTALPEVTLGLAHTVENPLDANEWASAIRTILREPSRYRPLDADVTRLRSTYHPTRIAAGYASAMFQ